MLQNLSRCIPTAAPKGTHAGTLAGRMRTYVAIWLHKPVAPENLDRSLHVFVDGLARPVLLKGPYPPGPHIDFPGLRKHPAPKVLGDVDLMTLAGLSVRDIRTVRPNDHVRLNRQNITQAQPGRVRDLNSKRVFGQHCREYKHYLCVCSPV